MTDCASLSDPWVYASVSYEEHLANSKKAQDCGYRPISLCMHPPEVPLSGFPRYSAIWKKSDGPGFQIMHLGTFGELDAFVDGWRKKGYNPRIVMAAYGVAMPPSPKDTPYGTERFGVVMEEGEPPSIVLAPLGWDSLFDVQSAPAIPDPNNPSGPPLVPAAPWNGKSFLDYWRDTDLSITWIATFGDAVALVLTGWYVTNGIRSPNPAPWTLEKTGSIEINARSAAYADGFSPIDNIAMLSDGSSCLCLYRNEPWRGRLLIGPTTKQGVYNAIHFYQKIGYYPIRLQGDDGVADQQTFAVVLGEGHSPPFLEWGGPKLVIPDPPARTLRIMYPSTQQDPAPQPKSVPLDGPFTDLDQVMVDTLKFNSIRAAQVAVVYKGKLVHAAAYTWGEGDYPTTQITQRMRVGSISKVVTCMAAMKLIEELNKNQFGLDPFDKSQFSVESLLLPLAPNGCADPGFKSRTIGHLMAHLSNILPDDGKVPPNYAFPTFDGTYPRGYLTYEAVLADKLTRKQETPTTVDTIRNNEELYAPQIAQLTAKDFVDFVAVGPQPRAFASKRRSFRSDSAVPRRGAHRRLPYMIICDHMWPYAKRDGQINRGMIKSVV